MSVFQKELFSSPSVLGDDPDAHHAYLLSVIIRGLMLVPIPYVLYVAFAIPEDLPRAFWQALFGEAANLCIFLILKKGYVRAASHLQVTLLWIFFTLSAFSGNGVLGESYLLGYPLTIIIAGALLGGRALSLITFLSLFSGGVMAFVDWDNFFPHTTGSPVLTWVISLLFFPVSAGLQYLSARTTKRAFQRARASEERYKLISSMMSDYTFATEVDEHGEINLIWAAGALERMTGYTFEEYVATGGWLAHLHPDDREIDASDMKMLHANQPIKSDVRTFMKNGEMRWERVYAHPVWDVKQNRLIGVVGAVRDITSAKLAEEKISETLLQQSAILNNIPDMAWLKDKDSRYIAVNDQFVKTAGREIGDILGKSDFDIWSRKFAEMYREDDLDVIRTGKRKQIEEKQRNSDGREYWVETVKTPIFNEAGEVIGTTGLARDISQRKEAELERETLIKELEAKNSELERFTYTVSHDLKAPLVTIIGFLSYLERDARKGDFVKFDEDIKRIQQAANKMQALLRDLLELSRIGRMMNQPAEIKFDGIVKDALEILRGQIEEKQVAIQADKTSVVVRGDQARLIEILQNLVDNAIKFMGDQPNPRIHIGASENKQGDIIFFVRDNGIGIDPQFHERVFGLFNKLNPEIEGTGVGLALVKRIVEVHGGRIWIESEPNQGTTFYFTLSS